MRLSALYYLRRISIDDSRARQVLSGLLLLAIGFALTGFVVVPSPQPPSEATSERFPCENSSCGCSTAERCWDQCCCHTDREKLAWAERNGVTPPAFLVARVANTDEFAAKSSPPKCAHCGSRQAVSGPVNRTQVSPPQQCQDEGVGKTVLMWKAAECRGIQQLWTMLGTVSVAPIYQMLHVDPPLLGWISFLNEDAISHLTVPDPPIP